MATSIAAGFTFWTCALALLFQLIGFGVPGWLSVETRQTITDDNKNGEVTYHILYQDYSLWYVTQCNWNEDGYTYSCDTRSYRLLDHLHEIANQKVEIDNIGRADFFFLGYGLIFSTSQIYAMQTLYVIGTVVSFILLIILYSIWKNVSKGRYKAKVVRTVFLAFLGTLSAIFTFASVVIFETAAGKLSDKVESALGIVCGVLGGGLMIVVVAAILINHFIGFPKAERGGQPNLEEGLSDSNRPSMAPNLDDGRTDSNRL